MGEWRKDKHLATACTALCTYFCTCVAP